MTPIQIMKIFDQYQCARLQFAKEIINLSNNPENINILQKTTVISQLRPLLLDLVPSIQETALVALGHLADHSEEFASIVVKENLLPQLFTSIITKNRFYKKAMTSVMSAVAKYSPKLSQALVDCGALHILIICSEDFDPGVKETAIRALGIISQHNAILSQAVVDAGAVPILVMALQDSELAFKRNAASCLSEISKHTPELAQIVMDNGAIAHLAQVVFSPDTKLKRYALSALSQISKHSENLAEVVIASDIFPAVMVCFRNRDDHIKKSIITLMMEVVKHSADLSQVILNCGGLAEVMEYLGKSHGSMRLPGIMMLGYVAAHNELLAKSVILSEGVHKLDICLSEENEDHIKTATVLSIGQIGRHTTDHAHAVATAGLLPKVLQFYMEASSSEDLRNECEQTLKKILQKCIHLPSLEPLLNDAPSNILKHVISQFSAVLPHDNQARLKFVTSGGLSKVQQINAEPGSALQEQINVINSCFPKEMVQYCTPGYPEKLLELLENDQPSSRDDSTLEMQDQLIEVKEAQDSPPRVELPPQMSWVQGTKRTLPPPRPPLRDPTPVPTDASMLNHPGINQRTPSSVQIHSQQRPDPRSKGKILPTSYAALHQRQIQLQIQTARITSMQTTTPSSSNDFRQAVH